MKILIAEDDDALRRALQALLERNNYSVDAVANGRDALAYLQSGLYDGAVLDIMMPQMDGLAVLAQLRKESNGTPILLLTARSEIEDKVAGLDMGANDYLTKPFDIRELLARLRVLVRRSEGQQGTAVTYGNVRLDMTSFTLSAPGGSSALTNKEYQSMLLLMHNPQQVISADRFLEKIWGPEGAQDGTVWTIIYNLRQKLEAIGADIRISNKRNIGYILEKCK